MKSLWVALLCVSPGFFPGVCAWGGGPEQLESLVGQLLAIRTEMASERTAWNEQERALRSEIALLKSEQMKLNEEEALLASGISAEGQDIVRDELRLETLRRVLDDVRVPLGRAEAELKRRVAYIPESLRADADRLMRALPDTEADSPRLSLGERLQRIVALMSLIESLQQQVHVVQETLDTGNGQRRLVDVMYLGLAYGFAVSLDDAWASVGSNRPEGWTWSPRPEHAAAIRSAVSTAQRRQTPGFVMLPLTAQLVEESK